MSPDISVLFENKPLISTLLLIGGGFVGALLATLRNRLKTLEYTVTHDRVALSADDAVFGSVKATWQGHEVTNLFTSTVTLENSTSRDFVDLKFKVFTGEDTLLLTQYTEIPGTTYALNLTHDYEVAIEVPAGQQPTDHQFWLFRHNREFIAPVLNRGQKALVRFLTTVPQGNDGPAIWLDILHPGTKVRFRPSVAQIHGVPVRIALRVGLGACVAVLILSSLYVSAVWVAALLCMVVGLFAQSIGAFTLRAFRSIKYAVVG